jgi:hypothetical protein
MILLGRSWMIQVSQGHPTYFLSFVVHVYSVRCLKDDNKYMWAIVIRRFCHKSDGEHTLHIIGSLCKATVILIIG